MDKVEWYSEYQGTIFRAKRKPDGNLVVQWYDPKYDMWLGKGTWTKKKDLSSCALEGARISEQEANAHIQQLKSMGG